MSSRVGALRARHLSLSFDDVVVFADVNVDVDAGDALAVVGENGAGKSCLLRALHQAAAGDAGGLVVLVGQGDDRAPLVDGIDAAVAARFGVAVDTSVERWPTLSPGEKRRALLAAALSAEPDVLLLDEPTNHLDDDVRAHLFEALRRFRGALVIASHDRALVDGLCSASVVLHRGEHVVVDDIATVALQTFEGILAERRAQRASALRAVKTAATQLKEARRTAQQTEHQRSSRTRMKGPKDHDSRGMLAQNRVEAAGKRAGRTVEVRRRHAERLAEAVGDVASAPKRLGRSFFVDHERAARARVAAVHGPLWAGAHRVADRIDLDIGRDDRVRLSGPNGVGKTTLLRALCPDSAATLYLPQVIDDVTAPLRAVLSCRREERGRALQAVAALGVDPARVLQSASPSLGEAKKLALALAFASNPEALFLDEPTNHLDLPSVERLAMALSSFPGAIVVVSHDDAFVAAAGIKDVYDVAARRRLSA